MADENNKGRFVRGDPRIAFGRKVRMARPKPVDKPEGPHARQRAMRAISARFLEDLANHYNEEGHHVFRIVFRENPETYFKALVSLVPKELLLTANVNVLSELTDDQILDAVERIRQLEVLYGNGNGLVIDG